MFEIIISVVVGLLVLGLVLVIIKMRDNHDEESERARNRYDRLNDKFNYLSTQFRELNSEINNRDIYETNLPQIQEYQKLKGYVGHRRDKDLITFIAEGDIHGYRKVEVNVYAVPAKLEELKQVLELNCPKKCTKKKANG